MTEETCAFCEGSLLKYHVAKSLGLNNAVNGKRNCSLRCHQLCMSTQELLGKRRVHSFCDFYGNESVTYA